VNPAWRPHVVVAVVQPAELAAVVASLAGRTR